VSGFNNDHQSRDRNAAFQAVRVFSRVLHGDSIPSSSEGSIFSFMHLRHIL
jgi:hypothetical protein